MWLMSSLGSLSIGMSIRRPVCLWHRDWSTRGILHSRSENLYAVIRHEQCVLELRRTAAVRGNGCPVIGPGLVFVTPQANHGLDRKGHTRLAFAHSFVLAIMRHVGGAMEQRVDAVAAVCLDNAQALRLGVFLDNVTEVANLDAWLDVGDGLLQALSRGLDKAYIVRVGLRFVADVVRLVQITVVAFVEERDVNVEEVAILQNSHVGNAVANDFVDRCAYGLGEMVVVQGRRV
jgi:hypothetical protein